MQGLTFGDFSSLTADEYKELFGTGSKQPDSAIYLEVSVQYSSLTADEYKELFGTGSKQPDSAIYLEVSVQYRAPRQRRGPWGPSQIFFFT